MNLLLISMDLCQLELTGFVRNLLMVPSGALGEVSRQWSRDKGVQ